MVKGLERKFYTSPLFDIEAESTNKTITHNNKYDTKTLYNKIQRHTNNKLKYKQIKNVGRQKKYIAMLFKKTNLKIFFKAENTI